MNKKSLIILIFSVFSCVSNINNSSISKDVRLDIPPRIQWNNNGGYCGASSIQQVALYYGTYVSQDICRQVIGNEEILLGVNEHNVLEALSLEYIRWQSIQFFPQNKRFIKWMKYHLNNNNPVLLGVYMRNGDNSWYDHIVPSVGYISFNNYNQFNENDIIIFNSCWDDIIYSYNVNNFINNRNESKKDNAPIFSIPKNINFGCAILGIADKNKETVPVKISLENNYEPNISKGEQAIVINGNIEISSLEKGKEYLLIEYLDPKKIPNHNFRSSKYDNSIEFKAQSNLKSIPVSIMSDSFISYRCIKK